MNKGIMKNLFIAIIVIAIIDGSLNAGYRVAISPGSRIEKSHQKGKYTYFRIQGVNFRANSDGAKVIVEKKIGEKWNVYASRALKDGAASFYFSGTRFVFRVKK